MTSPVYLDTSVLAERCFGERCNEVEDFIEKE